MALVGIWEATNDLPTCNNMCFNQTFWSWWKFYPRYDPHFIGEKY